MSWSKHEFRGPVVLTDCEIDTFDLNRSTFHDDLILRRCRIKTLVLSGATFHKKCDLKNSSVRKGKLQNATFRDGVNCGGASLQASFHRSAITGRADFRWAKLHGDATFTEVAFDGDVDFRSTTVTGNAFFQESKCSGLGNFADSVVEGELRLRGAAWRDLTLCRAQIKLGVELSGAKLDGAVDLRDVTVGRTIKLDHVELSEAQSFRFLGAVAASIVLERAAVEGHVHPEQLGQYQAAAREYGFLRNTFEDINRFEDEDWAYYQFKRMERKGTPIGWNPLRALRRLGNYLFLDLGCGYGTRPFRTLAACAVLVVLFACIYALALTSADVAQFGFSSAALNKAVGALDVSLMAFSGGYSDLPLTGRWRMAAMLEYTLGIVFLGLFVVAFSRKVIR